jgi:hypothetical protein
MIFSRRRVLFKQDLAFLLNIFWAEFIMLYTHSTGQGGQGKKRLGNLRCPSSQVGLSSNVLGRLQWI